LNKEQVYSIRGYIGKNDEKASYTNERLAYGEMQMAMNDCFNSGMVKVEVTQNTKTV
jgi:hypothetical protein